MADETKGNPTLAPDYALHRVVKDAADTLPETDRKRGINMASHRRAHVQVIPTGGANPNARVLWWSEAAGKFIDEHTPITKAGTGVDTPYEFTVECRGRIMFVALDGGTIGAGDVIKVMVSGSGVERV